MNKPMRVVLVTVGLTLAAAACDRGKAEADKQAQEATLTAAKMKAEADEAAKVKQERTDATMKLQREFDAQERKATYLKQKVAKTTGATKKNADAAMIEFNARHNIAKTSLSRLANDMSPAWDASKKAAEDDIAAVGKAVDALEHAVDKK